MQRFEALIYFLPSDVRSLVHEQSGEFRIRKLSVFGQPAGRVSSSTSRLKALWEPWKPTHKLDTDFLKFPCVSGNTQSPGCLELRVTRTTTRTSLVNLEQLFISKIVAVKCLFLGTTFLKIVLVFSPAESDIPVFEKSGKGGTYPRRYGIPYGFQDYSDGGVFAPAPVCNRENR